MKKLFSTLLIGLLAVSAFAGNYVSLVSPPTSTNYNAAYNALNGGSGITNNYILGVVPGASNVLWQLSPTPGSQPSLGTNGFLPAAVIAPQGNYPGTLYGPFSNMGILTTAALMATNATSTTITFRYAGSIDGVYWYTNYYVQTWIVPVNSTTPVIPIAYSNVVTAGLPYFALEEIDNPGVAALTNIVIEASGKPGL